MLFWIGLIVGAALTYSVVGMWAFGFCAARSAGNFNIENNYEGRGASHYYDEPGPWFAAILWPIYLLFAFALNHCYAFLWRHGEKHGQKMIEAKRVRIAEQRRIRVEQEKAEREAQEEIEAALRREEAQEEAEENEAIQASA